MYKIVCLEANKQQISILMLNFSHKHSLSRLHKEQKLRTGRHSNSILHMIKQIKFINQQDEKEQRIVFLRPILPNRNSLEAKSISPEAFDQPPPLSVPRKASLGNRKDSSLRLRIKNRPTITIKEPERRISELPETMSIGRLRLREKSIRKSVGYLQSQIRQTISRERLEFPSIQSQELRKQKYFVSKAIFNGNDVDSLAGWTRKDFNKEALQFNPGHSKSKPFFL